MEDGGIHAASPRQGRRANQRAGGRREREAAARFVWPCIAIGMALALWSLPHTPALAPPSSEAVAIRAHEPSRLSFTDASLEWHDTVEHRQTSDQLVGLDETLGPGLCAFDANADGYVDLFVVGGAGHTRHYGRASWWAAARGSRLLLNADGERFVDATAVAGLEHRMAGMGCATADFDDDGDIDLLLTGRHALRLLENDGSARFNDVTERSGITPGTWTTGAAVADFDRDGRIDVYVAGYVRFRRNARTFERSTGFDEQVAAAFDPTLYDPAPGRLYLNLGGMRFRDVARERGVDDARGRGLGAKWLDANFDGNLDLFVSNDAGSPSQLFLGRSGGRFEPASGALIELELEGARDVAALASGADTTLVVTRARGDANVLFELAADGSRPRDVAWRSGFSRASALALDAWGIARGDFDNDGDVDLAIAYGSHMPDLDSAFVPQGQPNMLIENLGDGHFIPSLDALGENAPRSSRSALATDLDNDGRLELVFGNNNDPVQILRAEHETGHWIGFDFSSVASRFDAGGGRITLELDDGRRIVRSLTAASGFLSQGDRRLHLGLGSARTVAKTLVSWPDGTRWRFERLVSDRYWRVAAGGEITLLEAPPPKRLRLDADRVAQIAPPHLVSLALLSAREREGGLDVSSFLDVWRFGTPSQRIELLAHASKRHGRGAAAILRRALVDPFPDIRLEAVRRLIPLELEASAEWLTPLLADQDDRVACGVAEAFRVFFVEEEALTHRKRLAIPSLIRMLDSDSEDRVVCAARALAEAETERAVLPLIDLVGRAEDERVRVAAISTLGRTRDRAALPALHRELDSTRATPATLAAAIRALTLLGSNLGLDHLAGWTSASGGTSPSDEELRARFAILAALAHTGETTVAGIRTTRSALEEAKETLVRSPNRDIRVHVEAARALARSRSAIPAVIASKIMRSASDEFLADGLEPLARQAAPRWDGTLRRTILEARPEVEASVLESLARSGIRVPRDAARDWIARGRAATLIESHLLHLPRAAADAFATELLLDDESPQEVASLLIAHCEDGRISPGQAAVSRFLGRGDPATRTEALACLLGGSASADRIDSAGFPLATREAVLAVIDAAYLDPIARDDLLIRAAARDAVISRSRLATAIRSLSAAAHARAIAVLREHGQTSLVRPWLEGLLRGASTPDDTRIEAGLSLHAMGHEAARTRVLDELVER